MKDRDKTCTCCKGWALFPFVCESCGKLVHRIDDNWVRFDIMHQDRIGVGTLRVCSLWCALVMLAQQREQVTTTNGVAYRGEGHERLPGCDMRGHYDQLQAICDALGFAAQKLQAQYIESMLEHQRTAGADLQQDQTINAQIEVREARADASQANYWYGVFQGVRGFLRALEGNTGELHALEEQMFKRIDWDAEHPHFVVPGFENVRLTDQHLPGEASVGETQDTPVG